MGNGIAAMPNLMAALNLGDHTAVGHVVDMIAVKPYRRALAAAVDRHVNHGHLFVRVQLLVCAQGEPGLGLLLREGRPATVGPALVDTAGHGFRTFGREGRKARHVVAQMTGGHLNTAAGRQQAKANQGQAKSDTVHAHGHIVRQAGSLFNPVGWILKHTDQAAH